MISGLLSAAQDRWIPSKACPLQIQLEINPLLHQYLNTGGSTSLAIEDCQIKTDLCYVDAILANAVYGIIRTSKLSFNLSTFNTSMSVIPGVSAVNGQPSTQVAKRRGLHGFRQAFSLSGLLSSTTPRRETRGSTRPTPSTGQRERSSRTRQARITACITPKKTWWNSRCTSDLESSRCIPSAA